MFRRFQTYSLHNVFECIQANVTCSSFDLSVHGHGETLTDGGEDERPFPSDERHLYGDQCKSRADDAWCVDDEVLLVRIDY